MDELLNSPVFTLEGALGVAWLLRCDPNVWQADNSKPAYELWFESFIEQDARPEKISAYRMEDAVVNTAFQDAKSFVGLEDSDLEWLQYYEVEVKPNGG